MFKKVKHYLEYLSLRAFSLLCACLSVEKASNLGGTLGRLIGPKLAKNRTAERHLKHAFPEWEDPTIQQIKIGMWENLGRILGEYPHIRKICAPDSGYSELNDPHNVLQDLQNGTPTFFISAHIANWEVLQTIIRSRSPIAFSGMFRAPNNPFVANLLARMRQTYPDIETIPKSSKGARDVLKLMKEKKHIGLIVDQKYNEGIPVPFFGKDAMTGTGFITLCQKYGYQIIPGHLERVEGPKFKLTLEKKINLFSDDNTPKSEYDVMVDIHKRIESWIIQHPEQWIWLHRRWPK